MFTQIKKLMQESKKGMFLIAFGMLLYYLVGHLNGLISLITKILSLFQPLFIGGCIAYVLNIPMAKIESLLERIGVKQTRIPAMVLTILLAALLLGVFGLVVIPQLIDSLLVLVSNIGLYIGNIVVYITNFLAKLHIENGYITTYLNNLQNLPWSDILSNVISWLGVQSSDIMSGTVNFATQLGLWVTSFIISIYLLSQKETYQVQFIQISYAFFGKDATLLISSFLKKVNEIFRNFIGGQLLEASILFVMYFVTMTVFKTPYPLLISALIAITSIIPYFGAMIGSFIGIVLIFAINPVQACIFFIYFLVIQEIENNLIYPRVVGNSVGLPAIWVVLSILAFGNMLGVLGMIVGVPIAAVLYYLFRNLIRSLLKIRGLEE